MSTNALGLFDAPSTAIEAAGALKGAGFDSPTVISPIPLHGIDEVLGKKKSVIKRFTFFWCSFRWYSWIFIGCRNCCYVCTCNWG